MVRSSLTIVLYLVATLRATAHETTVIPEIFLKELYDATNFDELHAAICIARTKATPDDVRAISTRLVESLIDDRELEFDISTTSDHSFPFESTTVQDSMLGVVSPAHEMSYSTQDIGYVGGRSAWGLEQLSGLCLPAIQLNYPRNELLRRQRAIRNSVHSRKDAMSKIARIRQLSVPERVEIARRSYSPRVLEALSWDDAPEVLVAVADRNWITLAIRDRISNRMRDIPKRDPQISTAFNKVMGTKITAAPAVFAFRLVIPRAPGDTSWMSREL